MTAVADALSTLLPPDALDAEGLAAPALGRPPEAVVRPASADEVATLMEWATREGVGVLPMASGRHVRAVAREGRYVALSADRLSGIEEYEAANLTLTAGAGTPFETIAAVLAENRQWAPFDPPHAPERSLGGLASAADPAPLQMGYGDVRHHVLGMTVVTGDGRILRLGGRVVKNVAGYDVLKAVVGSRGTLAVIASVCLRVFPRPQVDRVLVVEGGSVEELLEPALAVGTAPILPVSCVIVDGLEAGGGRPATMAAGDGGPELLEAGDGRPATMAVGDGGPALLVRLHGARETVDEDQRRLEEHVGTSFATFLDTESGGAVDAPGGEAGSVGDGLSGSPTPSVLEAVRDRAVDHDVVIHASAPPSRLADVLSAFAAFDAEAVVVDSYDGFVRLATSTAEAGLLSEAGRTIEGLGGATRVESTRRDIDASAGSTTPSDGERALIGRLREAFDPGGVLWPARR